LTACDFPKVSVYRHLVRFATLITSANSAARPLVWRVNPSGAPNCRI